jgi:hypothetical protein
MKCEVCGQGLMSGTSVYRTGEKGPGNNPHWRCQFHMTHQEREAVPGDVMELTAFIESDNATRQ